VGGETEFADLRAAYDALDAATKERIEDLVAEHSMFHSRGLLGYTDFTEEERVAFPPVPQSLVRVHPSSRRKTLYLASHASHIIGWPVEQGRRLLGSLTKLSTQPQFVYRHHWRSTTWSYGTTAVHFIAPGRMTTRATAATCDARLSKILRQR
jgi:alpha-ketoglutarate-dependent 2,4-dichlorophenoxyacetate dioxygenase